MNWRATINCPSGTRLCRGSQGRFNTWMATRSAFPFWEWVPHFSSNLLASGFSENFNREIRRFFPESREICASMIGDCPTVETLKVPPRAWGCLCQPCSLVGMTEVRLTENSNYEDANERGEWAVSGFIARQRGLPMSKPRGDSRSFDYVAERQESLWRHGD